MNKAIFSLLLLPIMAQAQTMGIKDIPAGENTTIEIKKNANALQQYEVVTDEDEIEGDAAPLLKEARVNWKTACADWKKELKEINKESQILSMTCGKMKCSTESMESTCHSKAKYKLRVKVK